MQKDQVQISSFFQVNEVLYYLTNLFIFISLVQATIRDMQGMLFPLGLADLVVLLIQIALLVLVFTGSIHRNKAIGILLIACILVLQLSAFVMSSLEGANVDWQITFTTMMSLLFASLAAFTVSKTMTAVLGGVNLVFFISSTLYFQAPRMMSELVLFPIIIVGYTLGLYFYHQSLEKLAEGLYESYRVVKKQKGELEILKAKADKINEANRPFVVFGRNTSGLIHDLKNDIGILGASGQLLRMKIQQDRSITHDDVETLEKHIARLSERVDTIKYAISASQYRNIEAIPVKKLITAAVYPFRLTSDLKNRIVFEEIVEGEPVLHASRYRLIQILENLVRNSCEAILDKQDAQRADLPEDHAAATIEELLDERKNLGKVRIAAKKLNSAVLFSVEDNGPGFGFCTDCESENCLECTEFKIGKTTKSYGSGIGMVSVIEAVEQLKGSLRIAGELKQGARVEVLIPLHSESPIPVETLVDNGFLKA